MASDTTGTASENSSDQPERKTRAWPLVKRFWPYLRPHVGYVKLMVGCMLLAAPLAMVSPLVVRHVIDHKEAENLVQWALVLIGMGLFSVVFGLLNGYCTTMFHTKVLRDLRMILYRHVQSLSIRFHHDRETGYIISRQIDDIGNLDGVMADAFGRASIEAVKAVGFMIMLFYVEWRMALGGLVLALMIFGFEYLISPALRRRSREARETWSKVTEGVNQGVTGHLLVQTTASETREAKRFAGVLHRSVRASVKRGLFALWTNHVFHLIGGVAPAMIVLAGLYLMREGDFTTGGLFAFFMYLMQMFGSIGVVAGLNPSMQSSLSSLERIFEILDTEPEIASPTDAAHPTFRGAVTFENVGFAYEEGRDVLDDIDFAVEPNTMVALVGPSGAGKTTLVQLVPRLFDPDRGRVVVDGHDVRALDLRHYRRHLGMVPQEIFLFDRTVAENIAYGRPRATDDEIRAAARAANADDFIREMKDGYDTLIGERGVKLSGGQRQRLAIARELLRDPTILILDEATSSLDSESEALIQDALATLLSGRTSFVIAHRLSTILRADLILVLDAGRVVERGRHAELLAENGLYARLYRSQFERPLESTELGSLPRSTPNSDNETSS